MGPNLKAQKAPPVTVYKLPWAHIVLLGLFMEAGILVAPFVFALLGWNVLFLLIAFGGWAGIQALVNTVIGAIAFGYLRKWSVPHAGSLVVITMVALFAFQVSFLTDSDGLGNAIPIEVILIALVVAGPLLSLGIALVAYKLPAQRQLIVGALALVVSSLAVFAVFVR